jgi:hypothetical protein
MKNNYLGDRMKDYESRFRYKLPRRAYALVDLKRGTFIFKDNKDWIIDFEMPILTQNKEYLFSKFPKIKQYE